MKQPKTASLFQIILVSLCFSFCHEETFSVRARGKPWKQLIDVHENSGLNRQKNPSKARVSGKPCKSYFFVLIRFPGRAAAAFCYSASWPCLDFHNHDCIACCMYNHSHLQCKVWTCCDFQWSFFQIQEQQAKFENEVYLLTRGKVDS